MDNKPPKPKTPQKQNLEAVDLRDTFQTPNYATDLLVPFLVEIEPMTPTRYFRIWECAAGLGKIVNRLRKQGFECNGTDLSYDEPLNFLTDKPLFLFDVIVTNPPFSLKQKFYKKCLEYQTPFALLVPAEYAIWVNKAVYKDGCEKIIPERRIDYITPNILQRIHEGEIWENSKEFFPDFDGDLKKFKEQYPEVWQKELDTFPDYCLWDSIYDVPAALLRKYSSAYYHSMWLTWGFNIGSSETFVELSNEDKLNI